MSTSEVDRWTCTTRLQTLPAYNSLVVEHVAAYHATKPPIPTDPTSYDRPSLVDKQVAPAPLYPEIRAREFFSLLDKEGT